MLSAPISFRVLRAALSSPAARSHGAFEWHAARSNAIRVPWPRTCRSARQATPLTLAPRQPNRCRILSYSQSQVRRKSRSKGVDYLAHALLEVRREAAGDDGADAFHALDNIGGDGWVRLAENVDSALAPSAPPPSCRPRPQGGSRCCHWRRQPGWPKRGAPPPRRSALTLRSRPSRVMWWHSDATSATVQSRSSSKQLNASYRRSNGGRKLREEAGGRTWDRGLRGVRLEDDMSAAAPLLSEMPKRRTWAGTCDLSGSHLCCTGTKLQKFEHKQL